MKATNVTIFPQESVAEIFAEIPLIRRALAEEPSEKNFFMSFSKIFEAEPGEVIIRRGEFGNWVYFLLLGQLLVYPEFYEKKQNLVCYISPGEMFGELAYIRELNRNATIVGDENCRRILFLGTDFSAFGEIDDFSRVAISTKISFYRSAVRTIRKRLELLKIDHPDNELTYKTPAFKPFAGIKNSLRELLYLRDQSRLYAKYLHQWNRTLEIDSNYHTAKGSIPLDPIRDLIKAD